MNAPPVSAAAETATVAPARRRRGRVRRGGVWIPLSIVLVYVLVALVAPVLIGYDHVATSVVDRLLPPGASTSSGTTAWLGTDGLGRDIAAQIVYGARTSLLVATVAVTLSAVVGMIVGAVAGLIGGWLDVVLSRLIDVLLTFPGVLLAIVIAGLFSRGLLTVVIALSVTAWTPFARVARNVTLSVKEREWVSAARLMGIRRPAMLVRHILPFVVPPMVAMATVEFALVVLAEAGLSFLGIGLPASVPSWGQTVANGKEYLDTAWWISASPGIALFVLVVSVGLLGDQLSARLGRTGRSTTS
ncbi:ABC transporter permease [Plantactinospora soyae]|uniref:Peptide/nickel transport system permease protein n=1 Tax=Plantactinospora soyae TaxID=1544732 RepID=A0A927R9D7_9ACTN|nr:ABC transporter permease [Plantactinospora soyae]MBE1489691.1 peptide/nickel transport system permease protein [Plantactinospora soyae]